MKRSIVIGLVALMCIGASAHTKLSPELETFVSVHGDLGYSGLMHTMSGRATGSDVNPAIRKIASGVNPAIGVDYRVFYNNFIFSIGAEAMYQFNAFNISPFNDSIRMKDESEGYLLTVAKVNKPRDLAHMLNINIPILFGGEWGRFYFMVGPKVSFNLYGATASSAVYETYEVNDRVYGGELHDMENHNYQKGLVMNSNSLRLKWKTNVMVHFEIGARVNHMFKHKQFRINPDKVRMYLAAYVDYGLPDIYSYASNEPWYTHGNVGEPLNFAIRPVMCSDLAKGAKFNNLNVGIKYTIAFELPRHGKSYIYDYNKVDRNYRIRGGNQTIK